MLVPRLQVWYFSFMRKKIKPLHSLLGKAGISLVLLSLLLLLLGCNDAKNPDTISTPIKLSSLKPQEEKNHEPIDQWPAVSLFNKEMLVECDDAEMLQRLPALLERHLRHYIQSYLSHEVRRQLDTNQTKANQSTFEPYLLSLQRLSPPNSQTIRLEVAVQSQREDQPDLEPIITEIRQTDGQGVETAKETQLKPVLSAVLELMIQDIMRSDMGINTRRSLYDLYQQAEPGSWERTAMKQGIEKQDTLPLEQQFLEFYIESLPGDNAYADALSYQVPQYLQSKAKRIVALLAQGELMKGSATGLSIQFLFQRAIKPFEESKYSKVIPGQYSPGTVEGKLIVGNETTGNSQIISAVEKQPLPDAISKTDVPAQEQAFRITEERIFDKLVRDWVLQLFESSLSNSNVSLIPILLDMCDGPLMDNTEKIRIARLLKRVLHLEKGNYYLILGVKPIGINRKFDIEEVYDLIGEEAVSIWMDMFRLVPNECQHAMTKLISMKRKGKLDSWAELKPFTEEIAGAVVELTRSLQQAGESKLSHHDSDWFKGPLLFLYLCDYRGDNNYTESIRFLDSIGYEGADSEIKKLYQLVLGR